MLYNPFCYYGDGYKGLPTYAPFDKIIVTAAAPVIPEALVEQLKIGGYLVIPVGGSGGQVMNRVIKTSGSDYETEGHGLFRFVPLLNEREDD